MLFSNPFVELEQTGGILAIDITSTIEGGGKALIRLLTYCVYSQQLDPLFAFLVRNYRLQPNDLKAVALYEEFVDAKAPHSITADRTEKSSDWQLFQTIEKIRTAQQLMAQPHDTENECAPVPVRYLPAKNAFDRILDIVTSNSIQFSSIANEYDPALSVVENLPDGRLSPNQRQFVENIWKPSRQRLAAAGFFTIANIGG